MKHSLDVLSGFLYTYMTTVLLVNVTEAPAVKYAPFVTNANEADVRGEYGSYMYCATRMARRK